MNTANYSKILFTALYSSSFETTKKLEHTLTNAEGTIRYMAPVVWEIITGKRPILHAKGRNSSSTAILYAIANSEPYLPPPSTSLPPFLLPHPSPSIPHLPPTYPPYSVLSVHRCPSTNDQELASDLAGND